MNKLNTKNIVRYLTVSGCLLSTNHLLEAVAVWNPPQAAANYPAVNGGNSGYECNRFQWFGAVR